MARSQPCSADRDQVSGFFDGLVLEAPGLVLGSKWRPESELESASTGVAFWAGVARKP
ncbi:MAG TPA: SAM-dependent methyltransferase [Trebonia sp.]|nr:SAM-dependent methyltransferase [Trebonia sp.]